MTHKMPKSYNLMHFFIVILVLSRSEYNHNRSSGRIRAPGSSSQGFLCGRLGRCLSSTGLGSVEPVEVVSSSSESGSVALLVGYSMRLSE